MNKCSTNEYKHSLTYLINEEDGLNQYGGLNFCLLHIIFLRQNCKQGWGGRGQEIKKKVNKLGYSFIRYVKVFNDNHCFLFHGSKNIMILTDSAFSHFPWSITQCHNKRYRPDDFCSWWWFGTEQKFKSMYFCIGSEFSQNL